MSLEDDFQKSTKDVLNLSVRPSNETLLKLYAFYKQATVGDVQGSRPGVFNLKERAKYDAWANMVGRSPQTAMNDYITLVQSLLKK